MPPTSPPLEEQNPEGLPTPTEDDIQILYDIVRSAEEHEKLNALPFRALFAAYDQVLGQRGINTANDRIYLRFLFRLGEIRQLGQSVQEAFESLLARFGIIVEFSDDEDEIGTIKTTGSKENDETSEYTTGPPTIRSRRASFSSFISYEEENAKDWSRPESRVSLPRIQDDFVNTEKRQKPKDRLIVTADFQRLLEIRRRELLNKDGSRARTPDDYNPEASFEPTDLQDVLRQNKSTQYNTQWENPVPQSIVGMGQHPRRHAKELILPDDSVATKSRLLQGRSRGPTDIHESDPTTTLDINYYPAGSQLDLDAHTLQHLRWKDLIRRVIKKWQLVTSENRLKRNRLEREAALFHARSVLTRNFEQWRSLVPDRRLFRETDRFFERLEEKAAQARDLYILTKAFTHWAQCTADEQDRSSVARRHIMRIRYFNAWKEVTAVNEMKVRRFRLSKFFERWRDNYVATLLFHQRSVTVYQENLVEKIYWRWFWSFCEYRAPEYYRLRLKRHFFRHWFGVFRNLRLNSTQADPYREARVKDAIVRIWLRKTTIIKRWNEAAKRFQCDQLVSQVLPMWQLQLRYAPIERHLSIKIDRRILSGAFQAMLSIMKLKKKATQVNRLAVLRNVWTLWNDELRCQTLQQQINDRLMVQALYKWVLVERGALLKRLNNERLQERFLTRFFYGWKTIQATTQLSLKAITESRDRRLKASVLRKWHTALWTRARQEQQAIELNVSYTLKETMERWHWSYNHQIQMVRWSKEALFYVRAARTIKSWSSAVDASRKQKLRDAYAQIRRALKMNIARRLLNIWRDNAARVQKLHQTAIKFSRERLQGWIIGLLLHWQNRLSYIKSLPPVAIDQCHYFLLSNVLRKWITRLELVNKNSIQSTSFAASNVESKAYEVLRKLQLRTLEIRSLYTKARTIHSWNQRRYARALLRLWNERAIQKYSPSVPSPLPTARSARSARARRLGDLRGSISDTSSRTLFPSETQQQSSGEEDGETGQWISMLSSDSTQTPAALAGFLNTPSKRAARAKALMEATFTPSTITRAPYLRSEIIANKVGGSTGSLEKSRQAEIPLVRRLFRRGDRSETSPSSAGPKTGGDHGVLGRSFGFNSSSNPPLEKGSYGDGLRDTAKSNDSEL